MNITLNQEQQLFVIKSSNSYSCLGFHVVLAEAQELYRRVTNFMRSGRVRSSDLVARFSKLAPIQESEVGTLGQYEQRSQLLGIYLGLQDDATWFDARTPLAVQRALEEARLRGHKVRIHYGDTDTGRDWLEEHDTIGSVSRSMGPMKAPLLIEKNSCGGPAILTHCIVRMVDLSNHKEVYRHPQYHQPKMVIVQAADYLRSEGYTHSVMVEREGEQQTHANFKSEAKALKWLNFMQGVTNSKR